MANEVSVKPTPIQRNKLDVAMELTKLHFELIGIKDQDDIKQVFAEYYSLVYQLERTSVNSSEKLKAFLPEEIKKNIS